jgi:hypothetical protein
MLQAFAPLKYALHRAMAHSARNLPGQHGAVAKTGVVGEGRHRFEISLGVLGL